MALPPPTPEIGGEEMDSLPIPNELVMDIFLRLGPADLIRASGACPTFRRLVADRSFRQRLRKLHAPPLLGFIGERCFHPAVPPHPSAPAAKAVARAADFSFTFLPSPASQWSVQDVRDGRVLLDRPRRNDAGEGRGDLFTEMVVCDPLYRRYHLLPPIPDDLAASVLDPLPIDGNRCCEIFLVPRRDDEDTEEIAFRVIWRAHCKAKPVAFVFCSTTGQWRATPSVSWSDLLPGIELQAWMPRFSWRQYAYGCFYWMANWSDKFLVLDSLSMEFSMVDCPPGVGPGLCSGLTLAIVEAGEGMIGVFVPAQDTSSLTAHDAHWVSYTIWRNNGGSSSHSQTEKKIAMASSGCFFMGSLHKHLLIYMFGVEAGCFTLDVKTFKLEKVCDSAPGTKKHAYCNYQRSVLSPPTVSTATGLADHRGVCDAVPVPELREPGPGEVQGSGQESANPVAECSASAVLADPQTPEHVVADTEGDRGGQGGGGAEAGEGAQGDQEQDQGI